MTANVRWTCPNDLHPGVLGPSKPRRDNLCRYCVPCSEKAGKLVERVVPRVEARREERKQRASSRAKEQRAKAREARKNRPATQDDFPHHFKCGANVFARIPFHWSGLKPFIEVREVVAPRAPKLIDGRIVIYDHGGDKYDADAQIFCALMTLHYACNATRLRQHCEKYLKVRPRLEDFKHAWVEIAHLLRSRVALQIMTNRSDDEPMGRKAS